MDGGIEALLAGRGMGAAALFEMFGLGNCQKLGFVRNKLTRFSARRSS